jgi:nitronate monooxygenase
MGIGVSGYRLAQEVSKCGQLGVVAGTSLDAVITRRLQDGDLDGNVRHALESFPFKEMAKRIIDTYFIPGGKDPEEPYKPIVMSTIEGPMKSRELNLVANFVEVFLAREGHDGLIGINYLEKVTYPMFASIYGAMLAGVDFVIIGAGIPKDIPGALDAFVDHSPAMYPISVKGSGENKRLHFDPKDYMEGQKLGNLKRPYFLPIVASSSLAKMLIKRANGKIDGFVIEGMSAGGHNAPPRGAMRLTTEGEPIYGDRDIADLEEIKKLGLPFWLAGSYGSREGLKRALTKGAAGVQVGTAFAFCKESGLMNELKEIVIKKTLSGELDILTSAKVSPTGFPFKVARLEGTLSEEAVYFARERVCDLGYLREAYYREDGSVGYRCPAESKESYINKGGDEGALDGKVCICNALLANIGMAQRKKNGQLELPLITCGNDIASIKDFIQNGNMEYSAAHVIDILLGHK